MNNEETLSALTKEELMELIEIYSKNWLAMDGVWFQSIERKPCITMRKLGVDSR